MVLRPRWRRVRMVIFDKWPARSTCSILIRQTGSVYTERQQSYHQLKFKADTHMHGDGSSLLKPHAKTNTRTTTFLISSTHLLPCTCTLAFSFLLGVKNGWGEWLVTIKMNSCMLNLKKLIHHAYGCSLRYIHEYIMDLCHKDWLKVKRLACHCHRESCLVPSIIRMWHKHTHAFVRT